MTLKTTKAKPRTLVYPTVFRPVITGNALTRAELVAGLRRTWQQAQLDALAEVEREAMAFAVASVLCDVAIQFQLSHGEMVEILGERMFGEIERRASN